MKQRIEVALLPALTGLLGFVASPFLRGVWDWCANVALPALTKPQQLSLVALLSILCLALAALLYRASSKQFLIRKYQHLENRGFWVHRQTKRRVCGNCLIAGIESPLACFSFTKPERDSWKCGRKDCGMEYFFSPEDGNKPQKI